MKHTEKTIINTPEYIITKTRRKRTGKGAFDYNSLPRYKRGVRKYYILFDRIRIKFYGDVTKKGVIKNYLENIK